MDAAAEGSIELQMDTGMEVHVQDGEEHVMTRNSVAASQGKNSVKFDCTTHAVAEVSVELPKVDTGKEVHVQDGEEHVICNSTATSEMNGDVGIEKQGEESEEGMSPEAGASYLHPLVIDESESDAESQTCIHHPSSSPEGSWLHALYYFQLVGAGFDGFELRELFRSTVLPWAKAFKAIAAALAEPEKEFEETHWQSMCDMQMPSGVGNQDDDPNGEQLQQQIPQQMRGITVRHMIGRVDLCSKVFKMPPAALDEPEESEVMHRQSPAQSMTDMQIMPLNSREGNQDDDSNGEQMQQQMPEMTIHDIISMRKGAYDSTHSLADPENEFEEMHRQSMSDTQIMPLNPREGNQDDDSNGEQMQQQMPRMTVQDMMSRPYSIHSLAESENKFEEMQQQSMSDTQMPPWVGNQGDGSNGVQLQQQIPHQMPNTAPKKRRGAAKKTAANANPSPLQVPNSTQPTCPRPLHIGVRKNTPVKKNKGYLKNRLQ